MFHTSCGYDGILVRKQKAIISKKIKPINDKLFVDEEAYISISPEQPLDLYCAVCGQKIVDIKDISLNCFCCGKTREISGLVVYSSDASFYIYCTGKSGCVNKVLAQSEYNQVTPLEDWFDFLYE